MVYTEFMRLTPESSKVCFLLYCAAGRKARILKSIRQSFIMKLSVSLSPSVVVYKLYRLTLILQESSYMDTHTSILPYMEKRVIH